MNAPTYTETAENFDLWCEYVNPSGSMTEEEFDSMTLAERIAFMVACFGEETEEV